MNKEVRGKVIRISEEQTGAGAPYVSVKVQSNVGKITFTFATDDPLLREFHFGSEVKMILQVSE